MNDLFACLWSFWVDIIGIYPLDAKSEAMVVDPGTAKLFRHGRSQAVRLPKEFRLPGTEVRVRRVGRGVLLEPMEHDAEDIRAIFAALDRYRSIPFMEDGRRQPPMPPADGVSFER
jgi:antitoxin VapB